MQNFIFYYENEKGEPVVTSIVSAKDISKTKAYRELGATTEQRERGISTFGCMSVDEWNLYQKPKFDLTKKQYSKL